MKKSVLIKIIVYTFLAILTVFMLFPIYVTIVTAFKTAQESTANFFALPSSFNLENFRIVASDRHFLNYIMNSVGITVAAVSIIAIVSPMVSYAIARRMGNSKYHRFLYIFFILSIFVPFQVIMVPLVRLMSSLSLMNQIGMVLLYSIFSLGQSIFLFVGYYKSIPVELEEAAIIDGCSTVGTFFRIIYPLAKPMTITVVILNTLWIWNDFLLPLLILNRSPNNWTLPLYQFNFRTAFTFDFNLAFASFMFSIVPMMILYMFLQKYIIEGITAGAVKS